MCDSVLFSSNKEFFRYFEKKKKKKKNKLHFGVKIVFLFEILVFLRIFWSGVVGAIDTFVAEHVELIEIGLRLPVLSMK